MYVYTRLCVTTCNGRTIKIYRHTRFRLVGGWRKKVQYYILIAIEFKLNMLIDQACWGHGVQVLKSEIN